jgi:putative FmdB family regulatory protein
MPIYAYRCDTCGFQQDVLQKMSDARLTMCPSCSNPTLQKQVTAAGFQLKGSGWYVTDFRNPAAKPGTKKDGAEAGTAETHGDTGSGDARTDAKTDAAATDKSSEATPPPAAPATSSEAKPAPAPAKAPPASGAA